VAEAMNALVSSAISYRALVPSDRPFVLDTFRRHLLEDGVALDALNHAPIARHAEALDHQARWAPERFAVATLAGDPWRIVGWAGARDGALLFAYVRPAFREWGIASQLVTSLVDSVPINLVYWTRHAERIRRERSYPLAWAWETCQAIQNRKPRRSKNEDQASPLHGF
jgi:GNAT superfamily N-acetyltransferase